VNDSPSHDHVATTTVNGRHPFTALNYIIKALKTSTDDGTGGSTFTRATVSKTVTGTANTASRTTVDMALTCTVMRVSATADCRVRVYATNADATADLARPVTQDPVNGSVILEVALSAATSLTTNLAPALVAANLESTATNAFPLTITPVASGSITVTFLYLPMEG
jgi:hypothetical protein